MKKIISILVILVLITFSFSSQAGDMKDIVIDTEDAINFNFRNNAELVIQSISGFELSTTEIGIEVKANVLTKNKKNGEALNWTCFVSFEEIQGRFTALEVNCN